MSSVSIQTAPAEVEWAQIVALARHLNTGFAGRAVLDVADALRLARLIVRFQHQQVGSLLRTMRR